MQYHLSNNQAENAPEVVFNQNVPEVVVRKEDTQYHSSNNQAEIAPEVFNQNVPEVLVAATVLEKMIIPESQELLDISTNEKFGNGNTRDQQHFYGLSRRTFYITIVATIIVVGVSLGAGLGVRLKPPKNTGPPPTLTSSSTSVPSASRTISSTSATTSPSSLASTFCIPSTNIVVSPHFEDLSDWSLDGNGSYTVNFEQVLWNDSSPAGVYLPILGPGQTQVNGYLGGIHQTVNLPANSTFGVRTSFQIVLRSDVDPDYPYFYFYMLFFNSDYELRKNITYWYNTTFDNNVNETTYTIHTTFETFSDSDPRYYFYGLSNFADLYVHTASIYDANDNSCPSADHGYSTAFLES
ncbi:hypothetical protein V1508DRAFT_427546, partial [Lipomyces doorenjongii]|uniref:uncharacterized protein n=1 Tax=Lipomyces doorenjongii TaxID=383834 RepID=UPI0034CE7528